jgi:hypothetical protein
MPLGESKSVMVGSAIDYRSIFQRLPRFITVAMAVTGLSHSSFRANEPERRFPPSIAKEVFGNVCKFGRVQI